MSAKQDIKIGIAIAAFNGRDIVTQCLEALACSVGSFELMPVVFDDGSTDGTQEHLREHFPKTVVIRGDGNFWWTGGTNRAVEICLAAGCDYVLLLNPDVFVKPNTIHELLTVSQARPGCVTAALVVDRDDEKRIAWAGSKWGPLKEGLPVWSAKTIHPIGGEVSIVGSAPYSTDEVHGRAVLIPKEVFRRCGLHDDLHIPHYGADNDYSRHLGAAGVDMFIVPSAQATLDVSHTGYAAPGEGSALRRYWLFMTDYRKSGQVPGWWRFVRRHIPWYAQLPTYGLLISLNTFRFWQEELSTPAKKDNR